MTEETLPPRQIIKPPPRQFQFTFDEIDAIRAHARERRAGLHGDHKSLPIGFGGTQLLHEGVLELPHDMIAAEKVSTLDNKPLALFDKNNWQRDSRDVVDFLQPAIRLASLFLTHKALAEYWHTICFEGRSLITVAQRTGQRSDADGAERIETIDAKVRWHTILANKMSDLIEQVSGKITFRFDEDIGQDGFLGQHAYLDNPLNIEIYRITICMDIYSAAKRLLASRYPDLNAILRLNFKLAIILVHELAHSLEMRYGTHKGPNYEAHYPGHGFAEAGYAWEQTVLGGVVGSINNHADGLQGLYVLDFNRPEVEGVAKFHAVRMSYIWGMQ